MAAASKPLASSALALKTPRKPVPLTKVQAYSLLYCKRGTELHSELREAWASYVAEDKAAVDKYQHLFAGPHNPDLPFVTFQQGVLKEMVASLSEEETSEVQKYIETRFERDNDVREHPWVALKVNDGKSDLDLERQYIKE